MKKTNYHTHTYRCGHANGNEEDMIQAAIDMGIEELGMCCHVPFPHYRKHLIRSLPSVRGVRSLLSLLKAIIKDGPNMRMPYRDMETPVSYTHLDVYKRQGYTRVLKTYNRKGDNAPMAIIGLF